MARMTARCEPGAYRRRTANDGVEADGTVQDPDARVQLPSEPSPCN